MLASGEFVACFQFFYFFLEKKVAKIQGKKMLPRATLRAPRFFATA